MMKSLREGFPRCGMRGCAHNFFSPERHGDVCDCLTSCLVDSTYFECPFFQTPGEAKTARAAAHQRAKRLGLLAADDTYRQRFTLVRWVPQPDGSQKGELYANVPAWLDDLAKSRIITREFAEQQKRRYAI